MTSEKKRVKETTKTLQRLQSQHQALAIKVESARRKFEKRSRKIRTLEAKIAKVEQQAHGAGDPTLVPTKDLRPARLILNPKSGLTDKKSQAVETIVTTLRAHGIAAEVCLKTSGKAAREWARRAVEKKEALVIVAGGDGTIGDVASQLVGSSTALGIIPTGTMNNIAHELGIPLDIDQACALLGAGITRQLDVGRVRANEKPNVEYFLESAGLGLAIALSAGQAVRKGRWGRIPHALRKLFDQTPTPVEIELDTGEKIEAHSELVTVSNAPLYGLNFLIAPEAKMDDGLFDIAVYDGMGHTDLIDYFLKSARGQRVYHPKVRFYRARRVLIRTRQKLAAISDNDPIPDQDLLEIELLPQALTMIVGQGSALVLPVEAVPSVPPLAGKQVPPDNGHKANGGAPSSPPDEAPQTETSTITPPPSEESAA